MLLIRVSLSEEESREALRVMRAGIAAVQQQDGSVPVLALQAYSMIQYRLASTLEAHTPPQQYLLLLQPY
jgi:hypothetical protein